MAITARAAILFVSLLSTTSIAASAADVGPAADTAVDAAVDKAVEGGDGDIVVTGTATPSFAGTKTSTPLIETPQPVTVVTAQEYLSQGAINISDTVRYAAGVTASAYGRDTRVDSFVIRGINALQFRDGMRDIFSYYASITSDPYNFSRVEIVRGPASVLFGQGSIGGLVNLVSKTPEPVNTGEVAVTYGSYDRKELLADVNGVVSDAISARLVARVRDADTYVDHVPDNRVMIAPSVRFQPADGTDLTLLGLYQKDHGGSTSQFLPAVGTILPNGTNPRLPLRLFVGKPGYDRYDGRLLEGTAILNQRITDDIKLSLKARYIDSDLTYFTHYTNSYSNPLNPYLPNANGVNTGRLIGLYADSSLATLNVFSTDNNIQFKFNTGSNIEHLLLAGIDYSWNRVTKRYSTDNGFGVIDIYNIDYATIPMPTTFGDKSVEVQRQLGVYVQDQIRFFDRVSVVLGARRDRVTSPDAATARATTFRAGIIGEVGAGISPFFSYTESFEPTAGANRAGTPFKPQTGRQYEAGVKWAPDKATLVTATVFDIQESGRLVTDAADPLNQVQSGRLKTRGFEIEASRRLGDEYEILLNYGYNKLKDQDGTLADFLPRTNASAWGTKTIPLGDQLDLRLGAGVRYTGRSVSVGNFSITTKSYTLVDGLAELTWNKWRLTVNATNLLGKTYFAKCLARGDCFIGAPRNVMATLGYRF